MVRGFIFLHHYDFECNDFCRVKQKAKIHKENQIDCNLTH